ncbi:MAG: CRTAC1 family protein [Thermoguttaceae bacterium]|nr:CRTAC1 family protein [Thermoguttaceae bacterium]
MPALVAALAAVAAYAPSGDCRAQCPIQLKDMTAEVGLDFVHTDGSSGRRFVIEPMSAGLATFDYDGDGLVDLYFVNGAPLPGMQVDRPPKNRLYRNLGAWKFRDVTDAAGVGDTGYGLAVAIGDYDNDGRPDIYLSNYGANVLYRNNGDGTFTDVTPRAGVATGNDIPAEKKVGAGVSFLDIDADGNLDIYCANYMRFAPSDNKVPVVDGIPRYSGPKDFDPEHDMLFRNNGDGTFTDISAPAGIASYRGTGMGIVCLDFDDDRDTDIVVMNDLRRNFLFENDGKGKFKELALGAGVAFNVDGMERGSMGIDAADFDNDGRIDLYQTSFGKELPTLYRNTGDGMFDDVTRSRGAGAGLYQHVKWGLGFADFDNDGFRDLYVANGHLDDNVHLFDDSTSYYVRNTVLRNTGGRFTNVSDVCGDGTRPELSSRGVALDDLDNDGRIDIVVLNSRRESTLVRNVSPQGATHWLQVRLQGTRSNRDGVGARVDVVAGDLRLVDEVHSGRGYQSHFGSRLHFGLGGRNRVDRVTVRWIGGGVDVVENIEADQLITIVEGSRPKASTEPGGP